MNLHWLDKMEIAEALPYVADELRSRAGGGGSAIIPGEFCQAFAERLDEAAAEIASLRATVAELAELEAPVHPRLRPLVDIDPLLIHDLNKELQASHA